MEGLRQKRQSWAERLDALELPQPYLRGIVMDYLLHEGYSRTAKCFEAEAGTPFNDSAADGMSHRVEIRKLLLRGDIDGALGQIRLLDPKMLDELPDLRFALLRQRLLDIIADGRIDAALTYAKEHLQPMVGDKAAYLQDLEEAMGILAFGDRWKSPSAHLLGAAQRIKTASQVNAALMRRMNQREEPVLHQLLRRLAYEQKKLHEELQSFPAARSRLDVPPPLDID